MNTPSHLIFNLCALGHGGRPDAGVPIAIGAVLPDAPMFVFYAVEKLVLDVSEAAIWTTDYFAPGWQDFFDLFNSLPLLAVGLTVTLVTRNRWWALEAGLGLAGCAILWRRHQGRASRVGLALLATTYVGFILFAMLMWA